ncbi:MAG: hypothetical protein E2O68_02805 [Deltaproteobacteria bacterium]|nr:MAG: hypothetical protein E2O68_02805 [Deltaproteobacteria bacterium]
MVDVGFGIEIMVDGGFGIEIMVDGGFGFGFGLEPPEARISPKGNRRKKAKQKISIISPRLYYQYYHIETIRCYNENKKGPERALFK